MASSTCTICHTALPPGPPANPPLCGKLACAWKYQTLQPHERCAICGRQLSLQDQPAGACQGSDCWATLMEQRRQDRAQVLDRAVSSYAAALGKKEPRLRGRGLRVLRVPAQQGPISRVPRRRRELMRRRLTRLLQSPESDVRLAKAWPPLSTSPATERVVRTACTSCRGSCCRNGGDHAYLTHATLQRVKSEFPELSHEEIVERYLAHATGRSYTGSCLFHQRSGCSLPRHLRSDTCNNFFCEPLRTHLEQPTSLPVVIVAADSEVRRGVIVEPGDR